ncbi:MAG: flagellar hook capping protein [Actinobacteria bacterium]|nr:flagellar hook capping protein [Actinomycetota bacterium]
MSGSAVNGIGAGGEAGAAAKVKAQSEASGLGKDQFLQLLVAQLKNQNPLSPVGSQEFMSQMAAFSTLEQVTNLAVTGEEQKQMLAVNQSLSLVGHTVTYLNEDETTSVGKVESVDFGEHGFSLTINGESGIPVGAVTQVS